MMVRDIEDDLRDFASSSDAVVKDMYDHATFDNPADTKGSTPLYGNSNNSVGKPRYPSGPTGKKVQREEEEVKLSYEIEGEQKASADSLQVAQHLSAQFSILSEQIKEYQKLNNVANNKLKASETKVAELEAKVDTLEEEAHELRLNGGSQQQQTTNIYAARTGNRTQQFNNKDMNKRTEQLRKALLSGENDEEVATISLAEINTKNFYKNFKAYITRSLPFKQDLRTVQARFGTSVASYFIFQRKVFLKMAFIGTVMLVFAIYHLALYFHNSAGTLSGYIQGTGYLPKFMEFSSFSTKESFVYSSVVVLTMVFITCFLCYEIVSEHKNAITLEALEAENRAPYSKEILCAWDFALHTKLDVNDLQGKHEHAFLQLLEDSHETGQKKARSNYEAFVIYARRTLGFVLYLAVVSGSFTAIIYLTVYASKISDEAKNIPGLSNIGTFIGPLSLQVINAVVPTLLEQITHLEKWDSAQTELKFLLFRVYLSNTLNTLILTLSYIILMDPFLLAQYPSLRRSLELAESDVFTCRVDQAADGLFTLVGTTWAIEMASFIGTPLGMKLFSDFLGKPWVKSEFNIAQAMVKKFSFLGLVYVAFPFAPLAMVFVPIYGFIQFKFEKYVIKRFYAKPKRPFKGQQAALLYAIFYMITYILVGMSVSGYFVTTKTMAKNCDIQDSYVELCQDDVQNELCTPDPSSDYYAFWGKKNNYPRSICSLACGPFVADRSALSAFKDSITGKNQAL
jgi:hypothetical protein